MNTILVKQFLEHYKKKKLNPDNCPGILSIFHGAFAWGKSSDEAVKNLEAMEFIAELAFYTTIIGNKKRISKNKNTTTLLI